MRMLVFVLVLLAAAKIGTQQYIVETAKSDIIIAAYRDRALGACREAARDRRLDLSDQWASGGDVRLVIGKSGLDVAVWQVDHALWQARFKNPYLLFTLRDRGQKVYCEFDVLHGAASVMRM